MAEFVTPTCSQQHKQKRPDEMCRARSYKVSRQNVGDAVWFISGVCSEMGQERDKLVAVKRGETRPAWFQHARLLPETQC